jgi:hypothetical protein
MGKWKYSSTILDLGTRWRRVVSFTPLLLYPRGNIPHPWYPVFKKPRGPPSRCERYGEAKNLSFASPQPVPKPTELSWLFTESKAGAIFGKILKLSEEHTLYTISTGKADSSSNASEFYAYSRGPSFDFWPGHRLFWNFSLWFILVPSANFRKSTLS